MNFENTFPYKKIKAIHAGIRQEDETEYDWNIGVFLYVVSDGEKLGVVYNKNDWNHNKTPEYEMLINYEWNHIEVLDTEYGDFIVAYKDGKCCCFSLVGKDEIINENSHFAWCKLSIRAFPITECVYDDIKYPRKECEKVLLLYRDDKMQYYNLENQFLSDLYLRVHCIDNEFIEYIIGDIPYDELFASENKDAVVRKCVGLNDDIEFPDIPEQEFLYYRCTYENGTVYQIFTNRNCVENQWEAYLIFYSKATGQFYKTDIYDEINLFYFSKNGSSYISLSGLECKKEGISKTYKAENSVWSDKDLEKSFVARVIN